MWNLHFLCMTRKKPFLWWWLRGLFDTNQLTVFTNLLNSFQHMGFPVQKHQRAIWIKQTLLIKWILLLHLLIISTKQCLYTHTYTPTCTVHTLSVALHRHLRRVFLSHVPHGPWWQSFEHRCSSLAVTMKVTNGVRNEIVSSSGFLALIEQTLVQWGKKALSNKRLCIILKQHWASTDVTRVHFLLSSEQNLPKSHGSLVFEETPLVG